MEDENTQVIDNEEVETETPSENEVVNEDTDPQLLKLQSRIPYDEDIFGSQANYLAALGELLEDSKSIALETLYPYEDTSEMDLPSKYNNWQIRCCLELYNLADKSGVVNYSENGIGWSKLSDGLSNFLMNKLTSKVGVPKDIEEDGE